MNGYTLMRATRETPRALWLLCTALVGIVILPPFGTLRHDTVGWVKGQIDWFDSPSSTAGSPLPPPKTDLPPVRDPQSTASPLPPSKTGLPPVAQNPNPLPEPPRLTVKVDQENRCIVKLMLNGKGPFPFIVDTGAETVVLTRTQGRSIGFDPAHAEADHGSGGWGGGTTEGIMRRIDLKLNDFTLNDFAVAIENETRFREGLLGISFITKLKRFDVSGGQCRFWW